MKHTILTRKTRTMICSPAAWTCETTGALTKNAFRGVNTSTPIETNVRRLTGGYVELTSGSGGFRGANAS